MKLNSDSQTLIENKVLLLYILNKVGKPISHKELLELVLSISDMNYFYFEQFLLDLLQDKYVFKYEKSEDIIYELTKEGISALELTHDIIPGIMKLNVDKLFKESLDSIKDKFSISADYTPNSEKDFIVRCKVIENHNIIFDIHAYAGSREQAKKVVDNWNSYAGHIYPKILDLLVNFKPEEISEEPKKEEKK